MAPTAQRVKSAEREDDSSTGTTQADLETGLEMIAEKVSSIDAAVSHFTSTLVSLESRLSAVEASALNVDLGKSPALPEFVYRGIKPVDIFNSVMVGAVQALLAANIGLLASTTKPKTLESSFLRIIDFALIAVQAAQMRMPYLDESRERGVALGTPNGTRTGLDAE